MKQKLVLFLMAIASVQYSLGADIGLRENIKRGAGKTQITLYHRPSAFSWEGLEIDSALFVKPNEVTLDAVTKHAAKSFALEGKTIKLLPAVKGKSFWEDTALSGTKALRTALQEDGFTCFAVEVED